MFYTTGQLWSFHVVIFWLFASVATTNIFFFFKYLSEIYEDRSFGLGGAFFFLWQMATLWCLAHEFTSLYTFGVSIGFLMSTLFFAHFGVSARKRLFVMVNVSAAALLLFLRFRN